MHISGVGLTKQRISAHLPEGELKPHTLNLKNAIKYLIPILIKIKIKIKIKLILKNQFKPVFFFHLLSIYSSSAHHPNPSSPNSRLPFRLFL